MRKSNFFHFMLHLKDENQAPIEVERAIFKDFHDSYNVSQLHCNNGCSCVAVKVHVYMYLYTTSAAFTEKLLLYEQCIILCVCALNLEDNIYSKT